MNHIRDKLPDMKARLNTLMGQAQQELNSFGDEAIYGDTNQARPSCPGSSSFL
jgi:dynamin 1-like protein